MKKLNQYINEELTKSDLKDIISGKTNVKSDEEFNKVKSEHEKLKKEFDEKLKKLFSDKKYDDASKLVIAWNKKSTEFDAKFKELNSKRREERKQKDKKFKIYYALVNIYQYVNDTIKNTDKKFVETTKSIFGDKGISNLIYGPVNMYINQLKDEIINPAITEYIDNYDDSILQDIETALKYLHLDFLTVKNDEIRWNVKKMNDFISKLTGDIDVDLKSVYDVLNDDELKVVKPKK